MATGGNIVVADATTPTPVNHTYVWDGQDPDGVSLWTDRSSGVPLGYWTITAKLMRPARRKGTAESAVGNYRYRVVISQPVMENVTNGTVSGIAPAPTISYKPMFDGVYVLPERSTDVARAHLAKMVPLILGHAQILSGVQSLDIAR